MRYLIVVEPTATGLSAYAPDLPGCVTTGRSRNEIERNMREAMELHLDGLREEGMEIPAPHTWSSYVEVREALA